MNTATRLFAAILVFSTAALAASPNIVISQVYGGGGSSATSSYSHDYIELQNRGSVAVDVTGWSVQSAAATGSTWQMATLSGVIQPGQYYLVQAATGGSGGAALPTPDATTTAILMSTTNGKVVLRSTSVMFPSGTVNPIGLANVVDFVGYGTTPNAFEGTGPTGTALTINTAAFRNNSGCTDTDDNKTDFSTGTPAPRNRASAVHFCVSPTPPSGMVAASPNPVPADSDLFLTVTVTPGGFPTSTGIQVTADLSSIFGASNESLYDDGTHGDVTAGDNVWSLMFTVSRGVVVGQKSLNVSISDAQGRSGSMAIDLTVDPPLIVIIPIHDIQGSGTASTLAGQSVTTTGIVTALKNDGFFMQSPESDYDADANTSEAIYIFTSHPTPAHAAVGNLVQVTGTVTEFVPSTDLNSPSVTQLTGATVSAPMSTGNALPGAIILTATDNGAAGSIHQLEKYEGMRIAIGSLVVTSPTMGSISELNATSTSNGDFYAVISGIARPFREPGIETPTPFPAGAPSGIPIFDANPERLRIDSDGQVGAAKIEVTTGAVVADITGVLHYDARTYTVLPDPSPAPMVAGNMSVIATPAPTNEQVTVASINLQRFFDTVKDNAINDVALSTAAFNNRLSKVSKLVRNSLHSPDVIGVQEVENLATLEAIADQLNADTVAAGASDPQYQAYLQEGNDSAGLDVGLLVKSTRVTVNSVAQEGKNATFADPEDGSVDLLNNRPSLVARLSVSRPGAPTVPMIVIVNDLLSQDGIETSGRVRAQRKVQAEFLANVIQQIQAGEPQANIITLGSYNAFDFNDGYVDVLGTIKGTPAAADTVTLASDDLVNPNLHNLLQVLPTGQQYSSAVGGNAQALDHLLVNNNMLARIAGFAVARVGADFPESFRDDASRPERVTDRDALITYVTLPAQDLNAPTIVITSPANGTYTVGQQVSANYACSDASGVANCAGPVANGSPIDTSSVGSHTFTVNSTDTFGNASSQSVTYNVTYNVLYNICVISSDAPKNVGSNIAVKVKVCDANGQNLSTDALKVRAMQLVGANGGTRVPLDSGNSNPGRWFRFNGDSYHYNLSTSGMTAGTYALLVSVSGDPVLHPITVKVEDKLLDPVAAAQKKADRCVSARCRMSVRAPRLRTR